MRHLIVAVCCGLQAIASAQAPGTASELADDVLSGALWRIAVATHTRIGFESVDFVRLRGGLKDVPAFPISSREEALKAAVDIYPRYEWRTIGDFVVVRPKSAWNDSADPFNRPVRNLRIENAMSNGVLLDGDSSYMSPAGNRSFLMAAMLSSRLTSVSAESLRW